MTPCMILFATPNAAVCDRVAAFEKTTGEPIRIATTLAEALAHLRAEAYRVVVLDHMFIESEPDESEILLQHMGTAIPLYIRFGITSFDRVAKDICLALSRRRREELVARQYARVALRSELRDIVTSLLLFCDLALCCEGNPELAAEKLRAVHGLSKKLAELLDASNDPAERVDCSLAIDPLPSRTMPN